MPAPLHDSWSRIDAWLESQSSSDRKLLQSPVSADQIDAAAAEFGVEFHSDLRDFYLIVNGTDPNGESVGLFPSVDEWDEMPYGPMAIEQVVREWKLQKELLEGGDFEGCEPEEVDDGIVKDFWNVGWIPFAGNGGGDLYCIDMSPADGGTAGQVISHSHETGNHQRLADSLSDYLGDLASGLESGKYTYGEDGVQVSSE
ncbi:MAG: SMI1/KNR4 family protein [Planctomycetota bacterium]